MAYPLGIHEQSRLALVVRGITQAPARAWHNIAKQPARRPVKFGAGTQLNLLSPAFGVDSDDNLTRTTWGAALGYKLVPTLGAVVDAIAEGVTIPKMIVLDKDGNTVAHEDENPKDSRLLTAILNAQRFYGLPMMQLWGYSRLLYGETFFEIIRNDGGYPTDFRWLNPNAVNIYSVSGTYSDIDYIQYWGARGNVQLKPAHRDLFGQYHPSRFIYSRRFDPEDDLRGYSQTLRALADAQAQISYKKFNIAYYTNNGQPGMMLTVKEQTDIEEIKALATFWRESFRGVNNFFKTHISHVPMDVQTFDPPDISKPIEPAKYSRTEIFTNFRVAPEMVGDTQDNPYQFSPEKKNAFMQTVIQPITDDIAAMLNTTVTPEFEPEGHTLGFDYAPFDIVSETEIKRREQARLDYQVGALTYNQYRMAANYEPIAPERDFVIVPSGYMVIPVAQLGKPIISAAQDTQSPGGGTPELPELPSPGGGTPQSDSSIDRSIDLSGISARYNIPLDTVRSYYAEFAV